MESRTDELAARLLRCPVGCAFLLTIERDQVPVSLAVTPPQAFARAAIARRALNPWSRGFAQAVPAALSRGSRLTSLAREVVAHPEGRWWTDPIDRNRQVVAIDDTSDRASSRPASPESNASWEDYAQRPVHWRITSTLRGGYSCLDTVIARGVGEWPMSSYVRFAAEIDDSARVREIAGPEDWHSLCVSYPRVNQRAESPAGAGTLSPDWARVATQWDGVHLTFMALLTAPFVRHSSAAGTTMLWSWDTEGAMWLPGEFLQAGAPLAALDRDDTREFPDIGRLLRDDLGIAAGAEYRWRPPNAFSAQVRKWWSGLRAGR